MNPTVRRIGHVLMIVAIPLALLAGGVLYYAKGYLPGTVAPRSFPQVSGEILLPGLQAPVDVYRDTWGVPHIYAANVHDLFFAEGFVHAQERFWQMDAWRHVGSGRLSEMFGDSTIETDAFLRTMGWREASERELGNLSPDARLLLDAYTEGVNAYLKDRSPTEISLEYPILALLSPDYEIQPWEPVNSMTWDKAMAWDLRGNLDEEIERAVLLKKLGPERVDELFPPYPYDHPYIVPDFQLGQASAPPQRAPATPLSDELLAALQHNASLMDGLLGPGGTGFGSNSWAVDGTRTATGMPMLANDPHLSSQMPSIWYQVDMHCRPKNAACPYAFAGFSFAGVPGIVIGHNDRIAWGLTNLGPDVMDLFIERLNPDDPDQYEVRGRWVDFEKHTETISVVGGEPVQLEVLSTIHGPVISTVYGELKDVSDGADEEFVPFRERTGLELPDQYVISLAWTALTQPSPFESVWAINRAQDWDDFREAARHFSIAAQNLLYADTSGNIGYQMPGDIPIRRSGDGRYPVPGWTGEYDWTGFVPFDELPYVLNPTRGYIVSANNQVPPPGYPYLIGTDWNYGFRAARIVEFLESSPADVDALYFQGMQADTFDPIAPTLVPLIQAAVQGEAADGASMTAQALLILSAWDFRADADSDGAAIFEAFWNHLLINTFDDELPKDFHAEGGDRYMEVVRHIANDPTSLWWDDQTTTEVVETRDDMLRSSFNEALAELRLKFGTDPASWTWGGLHTVTFRNGTLGDSGVGLIEDLFNRGPFPTSGSKNILNATGWDAGESYEVDWLPSMRMIVDLSNLDASLTVHTTGQSGHAYHPHYIDMAEMWATGEFYPMIWSQSDVVQNSTEHLLLRP